jgi:hypothetical protein
LLGVQHVEQVVDQCLSLEVHVAFQPVNQLCVVDFAEFIRVVVLQQSLDIRWGEIVDDRGNILRADQMRPVDISGLNKFQKVL